MMTDQTQQGGNNGGQGGSAGGQGAGDGQGSAAWYGEIPADRPAEFREWVGNKGFKDPLSALESYHNAEKLIGAPADQVIKLPKADDQAAWDQVWNRLGRPETPDAYELPLTEGDSGEFAKTAAGWFHKAGVPKAAAQSVAKAWNDHMVQLVTAQANEAKTKADGELAALKTEWGNDFDKNAEVGRRGLAEYGRKAGLDDADLNAVEQALGSGKMLRMFHTLGLTLGEHGFVAGEQGGGLGVSPQQARQKLDDARKQRIEGKLTESEFARLMDQYGPLAAKAA